MVTVHVKQDVSLIIIRTRSVTFGVGGGRRVGRWGHKTAVKRMCWCRMTKDGSGGGGVTLLSQLLATKRKNSVRRRSKKTSTQR